MSNQQEKDEAHLENAEGGLLQEHVRARGRRGGGEVARGGARDFLQGSEAEESGRDPAQHRVLQISLHLHNISRSM